MINGLGKSERWTNDRLRDNVCRVAEFEMRDDDDVSDDEKDQRYSGALQGWNKIIGSGARYDECTTDHAKFLKPLPHLQDTHPSFDLTLARAYERQHTIARGIGFELLCCGWPVSSFPSNPRSS